MTPFLDWQAFVSRFYPGSARHDYRVLKAYDAYRKSLLAELCEKPSDGDALRVWEDEGGRLAVAAGSPKGRRLRDAGSFQLDDVCRAHPAVVDRGRSS